MSIRFYPEEGAILICDFKGFIAPEMVKRRPVVVISPKRKTGPRICMVIPLSTTNSRPVEPFHKLIVLESPLPAPYDEPLCWAKCDMICQVSFERLTVPFVGKAIDGTRMYDPRVLPWEKVQELRRAVVLAMGLHV